MSTNADRAVQTAITDLFKAHDDLAACRWSEETGPFSDAYYAAEARTKEAWAVYRDAAEHAWAMASMEHNLVHQIYTED